MILVLARRSDVGATRLVKCWERVPARRMSCEDLSVPGWRIWPDQKPHRRASVVAAGRVVPVEEIHGVLVRLPCITPSDLPHIVAADRPYVAAEMTAFLAVWLNELACPVLNRPTPLCLWGPSWTPERWLHTAAQLGLDVGPRPGASLWARGHHEPVNPPTVQVTVVGQGCFGAVDKPLALSARRLADAAGVQLLGVHFSSPRLPARFVAATLCPELQTREAGDAVLEYFQAGLSHANGPLPRLPEPLMAAGCEEQGQARHIA